MKKLMIPVFAVLITAFLSLACSGPARATPDSIARSMADATTQDAAGDADRGKLLFRQLNCATCHSLDGNNGLGPTMKGYFGSEVQYEDGSSERVDAAHAKRAIINPRERLMSGYGPTMPAIDWQKAPRSLRDVDDLVAFIKTVAN